MARAELEEVDPVTGEIIAGTALATEAGERVTAADGFTWAYRRVEPNPELHNPTQLPVLCLHGIGSSSYIYRNTMRLLGEAGHEAIAVDWLGHGASDKVGAGACMPPSGMHTPWLALAGAAGSTPQTHSPVPSSPTLRSAAGNRAGCPAAVPAAAKQAGSCSLARPCRKASLACPPSPRLCLQPTSGFDYSADSFVAALEKFVAAIGWDKRPFVLMVHGGRRQPPRCACLLPRQALPTACIRCV